MISLQIGFCSSSLIKMIIGACVISSLWFLRSLFSLWSSHFYLLCALDDAMGKVCEFYEEDESGGYDLAAFSIERGLFLLAHRSRRKKRHCLLSL